MHQSRLPVRVLLHSILSRVRLPLDLFVDLLCNVLEGVQHGGLLATSTWRTSSSDSLLVEVHESHDLLNVTHLVHDGLIDRVETVQHATAFLLNLNLNLVHFELDFSRIFLQLFLKELLLHHELLVVDEHLVELEGLMLTVALHKVQPALQVSAPVGLLDELLLVPLLDAGELALEYSNTLVVLLAHLKVLLLDILDALRHLGVLSLQSLYFLAVYGRLVAHGRQVVLQRVLGGLYAIAHQLLGLALVRFLLALHLRLVLLRLLLVEDDLGLELDGHFLLLGQSIVQFSLQELVRLLQLFHAYLQRLIGANHGFAGCLVDVF